jgi:hypothetical protein
MNEITKRSVEGMALLPVQETDALRSAVQELSLCSSWADGQHNRLEDCRRELSYVRSEVEQDLKAKSSELPAHTESTMAKLDEAMQEATTGQIADGLIVLHGLFGTRGDPEVVAGAGVEIIKAEHASAIALYSTILALLRPQARKIEWVDIDGTRFDGERPPLRKFVPTIPEIIAELQDQQKWWSKEQERLVGLLERHAEAQQVLTKRVAELEGRQANTDTSQDCSDLCRD